MWMGHWWAEPRLKLKALPRSSKIPFSKAQPKVEIWTTKHTKVTKEENNCFRFDVHSAIRVSGSSPPPLKIPEVEGLLVNLVQLLIVSFQHGVLESRLTWTSPEASLRTRMPAIRARMTKICILKLRRR